MLCVCTPVLMAKSNRKNTIRSVSSFSLLFMSKTQGISLGKKEAFCLDTNQHKQKAKAVLPQKA